MCLSAPGNQRRIEMNRTAILHTLLIAAFAFCVSIAVLPQGIAAQTDKQKPPTESKEKKQDVDDDEGDDDDDCVSEEESKSVKVALESARAIALSKVPGTVLDEELEKEHGRLQYAFDIKDSEGKVYDVEVDANTGEIIQAILDDEDEDDATKSKLIKKNKLAEKSAKTVKTKPK
jgi:uncharacterized membrane protein YkoI